MQFSVARSSTSSSSDDSLEIWLELEEYQEIGLISSQEAIALWLTWPEVPQYLGPALARVWLFEAEICPTLH